MAMTSYRLRSRMPVQPGKNIQSAFLERKRVLFLDHTAKLGGGELALLDLVRNLDRSWFEPIVVLFSEGPLVQRLKDAGIEAHVLPLGEGIVSARKGALGGRSLLQI